MKTSAFRHILFNTDEKVIFELSFASVIFVTHVLLGLPTATSDAHHTFISLCRLGLQEAKSCRPHWRACFLWTWAGILHSMFTTCIRYAWDYRQYAFYIIIHFIHFIELFHMSRLPIFLGVAVFVCSFLIFAYLTTRSFSAIPSYFSYKRVVEGISLSYCWNLAVIPSLAWSHYSIFSLLSQVSIFVGCIHTFRGKTNEFPDLGFSNSVYSLS